MGFNYLFFRQLSRWALPIFFGKLEINGADGIPQAGPFILAPNHQNAFLDAIILGSLSKHPIHFLTRSDVFIPPFDKVLSSFNMLPVYRIRDGYSQLNKNDHTFSRCYEVLSRDEIVLIFPESYLAKPGYALRPLSKGVARLAFQAQTIMEKDLFVIPVGINYIDHNVPRHKLIVNYGKPMRVRDYFDNNGEYVPKSLNEFRDKLSDNLADLMLLPFRDIAYKEKLQLLNYRIEDHSYPELKTTLAKPQTELITSRKYSRLFSSILILPNILPLAIIHFILRFIVRDPQFVLSLKFVLGILLLPLWYFALFVLLMYVSTVIGAVTGVFLALVALFVRAFLRKREKLKKL